MPEVLIFGPMVALALLCGGLWSTTKIAEIGLGNFQFWVGGLLFGVLSGANALYSFLIFLVCLFRGEYEDAFWPFASAASLAIMSYCMLALSTLGWQAQITQEWLATYTCIIAICGAPFGLLAKSSEEGENESE